jgi:hypothetical protein
MRPTGEVFPHGAGSVSPLSERRTGPREEAAPVPESRRNRCGHARDKFGMGVTDRGASGQE